MSKHATHRRTSILSSLSSIPKYRSDDYPVYGLPVPSIPIRVEWSGDSESLSGFQISTSGMIEETWDNCPNLANDLIANNFIIPNRHNDSAVNFQIMRGPYHPKRPFKVRAIPICWLRVPSTNQIVVRGEDYGYQSDPADTSWLSSFIHEGIQELEITLGKGMDYEVWFALQHPTDNDSWSLYDPLVELGGSDTDLSLRNTPKLSRSNVEVTLDVELTALSEHDIQSLRNKLRELSGDALLTIIGLEEGSTKLIIEIESDAARRLLSNIRHGDLVELNGHPILGVRACSENYVITVTRAKDTEQLHTDLKNIGDYLIDITESADCLPRRGLARKRQLDWSSLNTNSSECKQGYVEGARLGELLNFADWHRCQRHIDRTLRQTQESVHVTVASNAVEIFRLPWERLLTSSAGARLGAHERVVIGYSRPSNGSRLYAPSDARPTRVLMGWSASSGQVPCVSHIQALTNACRTSYIDFRSDHDVIPELSLGTLRAALDADRNEYIAMHLLCHGDVSGNGYCLFLSDEDGEPILITPTQIKQILEPYIEKLILVTLCVCQSANFRSDDSHLDSIAEAIHCIGVPWVIGSHQLLSKRASVVFTETFYRQLLSRECGVEQAFSLAQRDLFDNPRECDWTSFRLYAHAVQRGHSMWIQELMPHDTIKHQTLGRSSSH